MNVIKQHVDRLLILSCCIVLFVFTIGLLHAWNTPCTGYEPNIYFATPIIFWIGLGLCYGNGIAVTLLSMYKYIGKKYLIYIGYMQICFASLSLICLSTIRGYGLMGITGDTGSHLGNLIVSVNSGSLPSTYYPANYAIDAVAQLLTALDASIILNFVPIVTLCFFTLGAILISRRVFPNKTEVYFVSIIALMLPSGTAIIVGNFQLYSVGQTIANLAILPLSLYLIIRIIMRCKKMYIPLFIVSFVSIFYHPYISIILLVIYLTIIIYQTAYSIIKEKSSLVFSIYKSKMWVILLIISTLLFFIWQWSYFGVTIIDGIESIFFDPISENDEFGIMSKASTISRGIDHGYGISTVFQIAGINLIEYGLFALSIIIFLKYYWNNRKYTGLKYLYLFVVSIGIIMLISMVGDFVGGYARFKILPYFISLIGCGFAIEKLTRKLSNKKKVSGIKLSTIFIVLLIICSLSVWAFYPSSNTLAISYQDTKTQYTTAETMTPHLNPESDIRGMSFNSLHRYLNLLYGSIYVRGGYEYGSYHLLSIRGGISNVGESMPYHFGYDTINSIGNTNKPGTVILVSERDKIFYQAYYPEHFNNMYTPEDFNHINMDQNVIKVYNNGGVDLNIVIGY